MRFYNFPVHTPAILPTEIHGKCMDRCGGWETRFSQLKFHNTALRTAHRWDSDASMIDLDGSLTGSANSVVLWQNNMTAHDRNCQVLPAYANAAVCANRNTMVRFSFNGHNPKAALMLNVADSAGYAVQVPLLKKRLTHPFGFMIALQARNSYRMYFEGAERVTNMSYFGAFWNLAAGDYIIVRHPLTNKPDQMSVNYQMQPLCQESPTPLNPLVNNQCDWYWDNSTFEIHYLIKNANSAAIDKQVHFNVLRCKYVNCRPPTNPADRPVYKSRPADAKMWSDVATWPANTHLVSCFKVPLEYRLNQMYYHRD